MKMCGGIFLFVRVTGFLLLNLVAICTCELSRDPKLMLDEAYDLLK
jgi:hypothetical protein